WINPNNHALDGGRASSAMEKECVKTLGGLFGWDAPLGHLAGGGTMANLEALWVAGRLHGDEAVVASTQAHYTHGRISAALGLDFEEVGVDAAGRMDLALLEARLAQGGVGTVVATMGTTGLGAVDPLAEIVPLARRYGARVHADAAYGGYFTLAAGLADATRRSLDALRAVDSIVIDPHKHGLQPYGCGCILFRDPAVGRFYKHGSPYTYFTSGDLHLGEISLECSRPGASAVALWATMRLLPHEPGGAFARDLDDCLEAARALWRHLVDSDDYLPVLAPELDIVVYAARADDSESAGLRARGIFEAAARQDLHLAMIDLPTDFVRQRLPGLEATSPTVTCLRSVLMKPVQAQWVERIAEILDDCASLD
ncbi:MAG: aminotransferase class V-fold PLP-dependent enzyme, partial [Woeseiaceae bacterium]|nr:aminotransferase class V-fold PLP-dependent enzyme [Woeseiaceae bacterium]